MHSEGVVTFPSAIFKSGDDFKRFRLDNRDLFDERYRREQSLGTHDAAVVTQGICGPCLRVTQYHSSVQTGELTSDGRRVPNWRQGQVCGCRFGLVAHERALIHSVLPYLGKRTWFRSGIFGQSDRVATYLAQVLPELACWQRLARQDREELSLPVPKASQHMVLAVDALAHVIPLKEVLTSIASALVPGGFFAFSTPFDVELEISISFLGEIFGADISNQTFSLQSVHRFGWDLIPLLIDCGFKSAIARCYWSEELGYLGPYNMVFIAHR